MMALHEDQHCVLLCNRIVGRIHRRGDLTRFVFEEGYWEDSSRPILGLHFEDNPSGRHSSNMRLPVWFSNLLPEGRLRELIAQSRKAPVQREMELLIQVGHDLPGAVRVVAADSLVHMDGWEDGVQPTDHQGNKKSIWSFSLAGVGMKFSMFQLGERLTIPAFGENGDWIVKFPDQLYENVPHNEFAMMTLAKEVGINAPDLQLIHRDKLDELPDVVWGRSEEWAYAIKRFDRNENRELIHIEDMAQVRGVYPEKKYQGSFETIAALAYRNNDIPSLQEFARRMAFNILIGNGDAHLKNWSLIYSNPQIPTLSPAYDIVSTFVYRPQGEGPEDMGLRFGHSERFEDVTIGAFQRLQQKLNVQADLGDVVSTLVNNVRAEWPRVEEILLNHSELCKKIDENIRIRTKSLTRGS